MTVADRIHADHHALLSGPSSAVQHAAQIADNNLNHAGVPSYSELVNALLDWNRASDQYKAERQTAQRAQRPRTPLELSVVHRLEEARRDTTRAVNALVDRLPRGL